MHLDSQVYAPSARSSRSRGEHRGDGDWPLGTPPGSARCASSCPTPDRGRPGRSTPTHHVGIDLLKKTIVLCVVDDQINVLARRTLACLAVEDIRHFFAGLGPFRAVVEATARRPGAGRIPGQGT